MSKRNQNATKKDKNCTKTPNLQQQTPLSVRRPQGTVSTAASSGSGMLTPGDDGGGTRQTGANGDDGSPIRFLDMDAAIAASTPVPGGHQESSAGQEPSGTPGGQDPEAGSATAQEFSQTTQAPVPRHPGAAYPIRLIPHRIQRNT